MAQEREIRAQFDQETIVMYQAYSADIAAKAVRQQRFVAPFSFHRMTWIKPSFLWLMHRSNWGQKSNQQRTLAVHISRSGWEKALSLGILTHPEPTVYATPDDWKRQFEQARVHIQWDTERSLRGSGLSHFSIQVGISRHLIREFVEEWIVKIEDISATVTKMKRLLQSGHKEQAKKLLPSERVYRVPPRIAAHIQMS